MKINGEELVLTEENISLSDASDINLMDLDTIKEGVIPEEFAKNYKRFQKMKIEVEEMEKNIKAELIKIFEENPDIVGKSVRSNGLRFTYVAPFERTSVDSKKLKEEYPEVYKKCTKTTKVKSTIKTTVEY